MGGRASDGLQVGHVGCSGGARVGVDGRPSGGARATQPGKRAKTLVLLAGWAEGRSSWLATGWVLGQVYEGRETRA